MKTNRFASESPMSIGQLAQRAGCSADLIRYYERIGLLPGAHRAAGGHRRYRCADLDRLRFARQCRALGFSLAETAQLLRRVDSGDCRCSEIRDFVESHLSHVECQIRVLNSVATNLRGLLAGCGSAKSVRCPVVDALFSVEPISDSPIYFSVRTTLDGPDRYAERRHAPKS